MSSVEQKGQILVYSIVGCPHCLRAKSSLQQHGLVYLDIGVDMYAKSVTDELRERTGGKTSVPQIFFNDRYIGGNSELQAIIAKESEWNDLVKFIRTTSPSGGAPVPPDPSLAKKKEAASLIMKCEADEYAVLVEQMKNDGIINGKFAGLFRKAKQGFSGKDFVKWMKETKDVDEAKAMEVGQALLEQHFSTNKDSKCEFRNDSTVYSLVEDTFEFALNATTFECKAGSAVEVGEELRKLVLSMFSKFLSPDGRFVDYKGMSKSKEFEVYEKLSAELQRVDLSKLNRNEKIAFFINIYNAMVIHATIKKGPPTWLWTRYKFFYQTFYIISGDVYTLQDIENGILRANKKGIGMLSPPFSSDDKRKSVALETCEPLIHFALNCGAKSCPPIKTFSPNGLEDQLTTAASSFLESDDNCSVDVKSGTLKLSELFNWYRSDFGNSDLEVAQFVCKYLSGEKQKSLQSIIAKKNVKLKYFKYDWGTNSKE